MALASPLGEAGAEADGLGRGRGRGEARLAHPLQDGEVEGVDHEGEALRGANEVADAEGAGVFVFHMFCGCVSECREAGVTVNAGGDLF